MRKLRSAEILMYGWVALVACGHSKTVVTQDPHDGFSDDQWSVLNSFGPLGAPPADTTNMYANNPAAATFGQHLFFEKDYSGALKVGDDGANGSVGAVGETGKLGCVSCHDPANWYIDTRSKPGNVSLGVNFTLRNAPSLVNSSYYEWYTWTGKVDSAWCQGANATETPTDAGSTRLRVAHVLYAKYKADYDALFPVALDAALDPSAADAARFPASAKPKAHATDADGPWELMAAGDRAIINQIMANLGKAFAAFERRLVSANAPIDRYLAGDHSALSASAKRGLGLFIGKAACVSCHSGQTFTDQEFHNTGLAQLGPNTVTPDNGRFDAIPPLLANIDNGAGNFSDDKTAGAAKLSGVAQSPDNLGQFRTKSLRHIAMTAPYFHNGSMATLADVVTFYDRGGDSANFVGTKDAKIRPLALSASEQIDLVEFLTTALTGDPVAPALQTDTQPR